MPTYKDMVKRQRVLADFGDFALRCDDIQEVLTEACRLISDALGTRLAKVVEIEEGDGTALVKAGVGWPEGIVGRERMHFDERSSEAYALRLGEPVITQDIHQEERFTFPQFMKERGVVSIVNVPIFLPGERRMGSCRSIIPKCATSVRRTFNSCESTPQFLDR